MINKDLPRVMPHAVCAGNAQTLVPEELTRPKQRLSKSRVLQLEMHGRGTIRTCQLIYIQLFGLGGPCGDRVTWGDSLPDSLLLTSGIVNFPLPTYNFFHFPVFPPWMFYRSLRPDMAR